MLEHLPEGHSLSARARSRIAAVGAPRRKVHPEASREAVTDQEGNAAQTGLEVLRRDAVP